jgi:hypothetical protein
MTLHLRNAVQSTAGQYKLWRHTRGPRGRQRLHHKPNKKGVVRLANTEYRLMPGAFIILTKRFKRN